MKTSAVVLPIEARWPSLNKISYDEDESDGLNDFEDEEKDK